MTVDFSIIFQFSIFFLHFSLFFSFRFFSVFDFFFSFPWNWQSFLFKKFENVNIFLSKNVTLSRWTEYKIAVKKNTFNPFSHWIKHSIKFCFTWKIVVTLLGRYFVLVLVLKSYMVVFRWFPVNWVCLLQPCSYFHNHSCHIYRLMIFSWSDKTWLEPIPCEST